MKKPGFLFAIGALLFGIGVSGELDLRVGAGAQYIYIDGDNGVDASTPFVALDFTVGYRL